MTDSSFPLPRYLHTQEELFRAATRQLQFKSNTQSPSAAAEWLSDNLYLVQQTCRQIREDMPSSFYHQLPQRDTGPLQGYPCVYAVAQKLIVVSKARLDLEYITRFVHLYQDLAVWLVPNHTERERGHVAHHPSSLYLPQLAEPKIPWLMDVARGGIVV